MDPTKWIEYIGRASATTLLAGVIVTGYLGLWVWGSSYTAMVAERNEYKALALRAVTAGEQVRRGLTGPRMLAPAGPVTVEGLRSRVAALESMSR